MSREAMKMALEVLENAGEAVYARGGIAAVGSLNIAAQALRKALETNREWVGLTADEIWRCNRAKRGSAVEFHICSAHQNVEDFAEAIEAKLKEKNT